MCILLYPDVPIGRIICISMYLGVPIERTTKSHEEVPSFVSHGEKSPQLRGTRVSIENLTQSSTLGPTWLS